LIFEIIIVGHQETGVMVMKRKLYIGLIILLAAIVIATAVTRPLWVGIPLIAVWIFLVWAVRKKKDKIFAVQVEPEVAGRRLKRLKVILMVAGIALAVGIVGVVLHNVIYGLTENEEVVSFSIGFLGLVVFVVSTIYCLVVFLIGRLNPT
jgi:hypothetical protein